MKWLVTLFGVIAVATAVTVVYVVTGERDPVPDELTACVQEAGARRVVRADSIGPMRVDLLRNELLQGEQVMLRNGYRAVQLRPVDGSYVTLVVQRPDQFGLRIVEVIPDRPSTFPLVAYAEGAKVGAMQACVDEAR